MDVCSETLPGLEWVPPVGGLVPEAICTFCRVEHGQLDTTEAAALLSADELSCWRNLNAGERRRTEWLAGRMAAKQAVGRLIVRRYDVRLPMHQITIGIDKDGRLRARLPNTSALAAPEISISHTRGLSVAVALDTAAGTRVGIDVERVVRLEDRVVRMAFRESELGWFKGLIGHQRDERILQFWCVKEAAAKATGRGLHGRPQDYVVADSLEPSGSAATRVRVCVPPTSPSAVELSIEVHSWIEEDLAFALGTFPARA